MIVGEDIFVMLLVENFFKTFTHKEISDATRSTEVIVSLSTDNRESVDEMVRKAVAAGRPHPASPKTTDSCTNMASRIWMGISGDLLHGAGRDTARLVQKQGTLFRCHPERCQAAAARG